MTIKKPLKYRVFLFFIILLGGWGTNALASESLTEQNLLGAAFGFYSLTSTSSINGLGTAQINYHRAIAHSFSLDVQLENRFTAKLLKSDFMGFDFGAAYSLGRTFNKVTNVSDILTIREDDKWGLLLNAGYSIRITSNSAANLNFSGPYVAAQPLYTINETFKAYSRIQLSLLSGTASNLTYFSATVGIACGF